MRINPGGLAAENIVGREREIARYWKILDRQGLVLAGERRIGKTHIMAKMHEVGRPGFVTIYQELEAVHSLTELVRSVYVAVNAHVSRTAQLKAKAVEIWTSLVPKRIGALELPTARENCKQLLTSAITDTLAAFDEDQKLVLMWDELPLMVHNIKEREGADSAIQLLDVLRHLRQTQLDRAAIPADVASAVDALLLADHDPANFHYNDARIGTYYDDEEATLARRVLDVIAASDMAMSMPEIVNRVRHQAPKTADDAVRSICVLLRQDHYLTLGRQGSTSLHDFRWPILKRWWKETRL